MLQEYEFLLSSRKYQQLTTITIVGRSEVVPTICNDVCSYYQDADITIPRNAITDTSACQRYAHFGEGFWLSMFLMDLILPFSG
jgi:hypothetical protein